MDVCIVGAGAAGGVLGAKLAEAGLSVVVLEAGRHWDPTRDFVSDELASRELFWTDERITGGADAVELGANNSGRGVGGGTVHDSMIAMRAHPHDFRRRSLDGGIAGAEVRDWPLGFDDLEPHHEEEERDLQIAGPTFYPWGRRRRRYPQREHELNAAARVLVYGCSALGIPSAPAPVATLRAPFRDRPPCVYRGFCNYGCTTNAKSSVLVTYVPRAIRAGAEVRSGAMAARVVHDARGHACGVLHFRGGDEALHLQRARNVMVHSGHQVFARFEERISQNKAPPALALTEHFNRTMADADFVCGYTIEAVGPHPVDFAARVATARGLWGDALRRVMMDYNHYAGLGIVGEVLPQRANAVGLHATERDGHGLPVAHVRFAHHENDRRLVRHAVTRMGRIVRAAGGTDVWEADRTAHLRGTCRMGTDPRDSVVDADCRSHDVPNLFVCDGSVFPTSTAVHPSLTIEAIAARTADRIVELARGAGGRVGASA